MKIDKTLIRNFLTIRYNPREKPPLKLASWRDFLPENNDADGKITEKLLLQSINKSIPNNESPISISLSSGIDSSLCLALLRKSFPKRKIVAICGVFEDGYDESINAKKIASKFEADFKVLQMESIFTNMPEIISISKKPRWNTYNHLVAKEAKRKSNFLITGDGADELYGGYVFRYSKFQNTLRPNDGWLEKVKKYLDCHNRDWVPDQNILFEKTLKFNWNKIYEYFRPYFHNKLESLTQVMLADFNGKLLYDFIPTGKMIFDHYNIKGIPIFLDSSVISFARKLSLKQKYDLKSSKGKLILRQITKRLDVNHIQEKRGFSPSLLLDWQKHGKGICQSYLLDKKSLIFEKKLINRNWVEKAFFRVETDGDIRYLNRLISVLALEIWLRLFVTKEISPKTKMV